MAAQFRWMILGPVLAILAWGGPSVLHAQDRAKDLAELKSQYRIQQNEAMKAYFAGKSAQEKSAALAKMPKAPEFTTKALKIAEADLKDEIAFDALRFCLGISQGRDQAAVNLLAEHHAENPQMKMMLGPLVMHPQEPLAKLLRKVLTIHPDADAKGLACLGLANLAVAKARRGDKSASEDAERYLGRIEKEFSQVSTGQATLGQIAKRSLYEVQNLFVGRLAPNIHSEDLDGKKVQLADYKGQVVVLDIWATWCGPCRAMIPHEREMVEKFKGQPFTLISVSADEEKETLQNFLKKESMPWVHWWEGRGTGFLQQWNVQYFPTIYVIDARGVIRYRDVRGQELEEAVAGLLKETKGTR